MASSLFRIVYFYIHAGNHKYMSSWDIKSLIVMFVFYHVCRMMNVIIIEYFIVPNVLFILFHALPDNTCFPDCVAFKYL